VSLTPGESDRLLLFTQAQLARARRERGLLLNAPEATALIADAVCEWARDGLDLPTVRAQGAQILSPDDVLPEVPAVVSEVRVEARFDDGTRLVVVSDPFRIGATRDASAFTPEAIAEISVQNTASTAVGISSHIHLAEVNPRLRLDRGAAFGMRAAIPTGETVWIQPGATVTLALTPITGERIVIGNTGVIDGPLDDPATRDRALATLRACGYLDVIDGNPVNADADAEHAVANLMAKR
jgi:urease subunit gamma/beta